MTGETKPPLDAAPARTEETRPPLTPQAQRALAEAAERRARLAQDAQPPREIGGRGGPDPVRYGDWETGGIASDF